MPSIEVEIEIYCGTCGDGLCNKTDVVRTRNRQAESFRVEACASCMKNSYDEGYEAAKKYFEEHNEQ